MLLLTVIVSTLIMSFRVKSWVTGNKVIVKNVNANIPVSLSWFLLPFLAFKAKKGRRNHDKDTGMFAFTFLTVTLFPVTHVLTWMKTFRNKDFFKSISCKEFASPILALWGTTCIWGMKTSHQDCSETVNSPVFKSQRKIR